ncbi:MAG: LLM class F420-dependent oxidoreductase [Nitrososphaerales archaeon]
MGSRIRFGVLLPQGWLDDLQGVPPEEQFEFSRKTALGAEDLGFSSVWAYDHFIPYREFEPLESKPMLECWTLLSAIAGMTSKVRLGQVVLCNSYRSPALLAKMGATLDVISSGRLDFGIGAGWYDREYESYGYPFARDSERIAQLDEALHIIRAMWTEEKASFVGRHYQIKDAISTPKPVQKPHPPIMVGGTGEKLLLRVAAKHADRYNHPFGTPVELKHKVEVLKEHCAAVGRDHREIEISILLRVIMGSDDAEVRRIIDEKLRSPEESVEQYLERTNGKATVGTPEQVTATLGEYMQAGVTHFILHFHGMDQTLKMMKMFAAEVMRKI